MINWWRWLEESEHRLENNDQNPARKKDCLAYLANLSLVSDADWCFHVDMGKGEPELKLQRLKPIVAVSHLTLSCDNEYLKLTFW